MPKNDVDRIKVVMPKWRDHLKDVEKQRLAIIEARLERKEKTIMELAAERRALMRRCIMRSRRAK